MRQTTVSLALLIAGRFGTHDPTSAVQEIFVTTAKLLLASSAATAGAIWLVPGTMAIGR